MVNRSETARSAFRAPWVIFWTALGLRLLCILIGHTYRIPASANHFHFGFEMGRIAQSLALGQGYSNPFNGPSGPTAWTPPLYPLLIALSFKLFGIYSSAAALFLLACNSVFSAAIAPAVYEIAARCFDAYGIARRRARIAHPVAMWAAWMWAVYPAALQYAIHWIWEMSLSACLFTWTLVFALRLRGTGERPNLTLDSDLAAGPGNTLNTRWSEPPWLPQPEPSSLKLWLRWAFFGLLWGLIALTNASLLLCLPATLVWIAWPNIRSQFHAVTRSPRTLLQPLAGAALACLIFAAVLSPWVIRNERVLHAFIPTRGNLGIELYASTLPSNDGFPWGTTLPLWPGDPEFQRYVRMGEVPYSNLLGAQAKARLRANPKLFLRFTLDRFLFFWDDTPHAVENHATREFLRDLSFAFLSLCGLLGLALALHRRVPGVGLFALAFILIPLPYYLVTVQARFRHPIEPLIAVLAVYLFRSTERRNSERTSPSST
jgi:hypothetical protein